MSSHRCGGRVLRYLGQLGPAPDPRRSAGRDPDRRLSTCDRGQSQPSARCREAPTQARRQKVSLFKPSSQIWEKGAQQNAPYRDATSPQMAHLTVRDHRRLSMTNDRRHQEPVYSSETPPGRVECVDGIASVGGAHSATTCRDQLRSTARYGVAGQRDAVRAATTTMPPPIVGSAMHGLGPTRTRDPPPTVRVKMSPPSHHHGLLQGNP
jgi:hypothetical protein